MVDVTVFLNFNKAGLFKGNFFSEGSQFVPSLAFKFQEELFQYYYNFIQLLDNLFKAI